MNPRGRPSPLARYDVLLMDMDGVLYLHQEPIADAVRFVSAARGMGKARVCHADQRIAPCL